MSELFEENVTLTDKELAESVTAWVSKLCKTGGKAWILSVPVKFNKDPDILITELVERFNRLKEENERYRKAIENISKYITDYHLANAGPLSPAAHILSICKEALKQQ